MCCGFLTVFHFKSFIQARGALSKYQTTSVISFSVSTLGVGVKRYLSEIWVGRLCMRRAPLLEKTCRPCIQSAWMQQPCDPARPALISRRECGSPLLGREKRVFGPPAKSVSMSLRLVQPPCWTPTLPAGVTRRGPDRSMFRRLHGCAAVARCVRRGGSRRVPRGLRRGNSCRR